MLTEVVLLLSHLHEYTDILNVPAVTWCVTGKRLAMEPNNKEGLRTQPVSQNHTHTIPLLMQSVALHTFAFVVFKRLLCGWMLVNE